MSDNQKKILEIGILFEDAKDKFQEDKKLKRFIYPFNTLIKAIDAGLEFPNEINQADKECLILVSSAYKFNQSNQVQKKMLNILARMKIIIRIFEYII